MCASRYRRRARRKKPRKGGGRGFNAKAMHEVDAVRDRAMP
jgi:hypothetical protein